MIFNFKNIIFLIPFIALLSSCDKGYQVRVSNYYIEPLDSVVIGEFKAVFTEIPLETTTDFTSIKKGKYHITFTTKTKKKFYSSITIPKNGTGNRTVQIDGISQVSILEE